jgi:RNA polymerase sigma-70 factor (ECF subfamily)
MNKDTVLYLVEKCRQNDRKSQMQLYDLYCEAMYNTANNFVKDAMLAQDLMQESFIKAFKKIHTFTGEATFGAWLKRIVINQCLDYLKKQKLQTTEINEEVISMVEDDNWNIQPEINLQEIYNCIELLPQKCKNVIKLYLLEGYDHQEVAQILNISEVASRSQLSRGKNKLKELLTQHNHEN